MTQELPSKTSIVIIGGGVIGVSAALNLAENGIPVALLEKGKIAAEQSSRNWGWIRRQERDSAELPLMNESLKLWIRIAAELDVDIGFRRGGITSLAENETELAAKAAWLEQARPYGVGSQLLGREKTNRLASRSDDHFHGALHTSDDAYAEPALAVPAISRLARARGAQLFEGVAVRTLIREGGVVRGVETERGSIRADTVILAGGAWSRTFLENEGQSLPQLAIRSSAFRTLPAGVSSKEASLTGASTTSTFGAAGASIRPRRDGGFTVARSGAAGFELIPAAFQHFAAFLPILKEQWPVLKLRAGASFFGPLGRHRWHAEQASPFETVRILNPTPDSRLLNDVLAEARTLYPLLANAQIQESWAGMIDVTPDELPIIDTVSRLPGLVVATGFSGHGFGLGPAAGLLAAQLATGENPVVDADRFRLDRFQRRYQEK